MKIGLIDVDGHNFPNLALMKISAYHKQNDDVVSFVNALESYDIIYQSKIFTFTPDYQFCLQAGEIKKGGTGYDLKSKLPFEIENIYPDYSIYPELTKNTAYGYLTRGCPRKCAFCIVSEKEGCTSNKVSDLKQFWNGQKDIKLLDPNLTASKDRIELLNQLIESKARVDFTQGIDIRMIDNEVVNLLNQIKTKQIHFAWDNYEMNTYEKLKKYRPDFKKNGRDLSVYVLTNFNTTFEQDLERVYKLRELDYTPYVMIYDKYNAPQNVRQLARWVNNRFIWRSCERFEDYDCKRR